MQSKASSIAAVASFRLHQRVRHTLPAGNTIATGTVTETLPNGTVIVRWDGAAGVYEWDVENQALYLRAVQS